jgi:outer membrane protein assembly factor BamB/orotate phosphoribosyltransferase
MDLEVQERMPAFGQNMPPEQVEIVALSCRAWPEWEALRQQIYQKALQITTRPTFDFREMFSDPRNVEMAGRIMWALIKPFRPQVLIGPGFGAAPLVFATAQCALRDGIEVQTLMVRDQRKQHNKKKWVEGRRQPAGSRAIIIDDFMEEGSAIGLIKQALDADQHELELCAAAVFFDMWQPLGSRQISTSMFPVVSAFTRHDIGLTRDCFDAVPPTMKGAFPDFVGKPAWWRFELNSDLRYELKCAPVIADGAVFVADDSSQVWRFNLQDGSSEWCYQSLEQPVKGIVQRLQYLDNSVVFGCYDGTVTRLDAKTGRILWRYRQDSSIHATPEVDLLNQRLFINTEQWNQGQPHGHVQALDWLTGRLLWSHRLGYWPPASISYCPNSRAVIAPCNDQTVTCLDGDTGAMRWVCRSDGLVRGRAAIAQDRVYLATENGLLQCLDLHSGEVLWSRRYGKPLWHQFLLVHEGQVFVLDGRWHLLAFDAETGELCWLSRLRAAGCWCPVTYGQYLVVLSQGGELAVFEPRLQRKVWEDYVGGQYRQPPAIADGYMAIASNNVGLKVFRINELYNPS